MFKAFLVFKKHTRKAHPQVNFKRLQKVQIWAFWVIGTLNQLFMRGSSTQIKFSKISVR